MHPALFFLCQVTNPEDSGCDFSRESPKRGQGRRCGSVEL